VIERLSILKEHGRTVEFNNEMSLEELLKIYEMAIEEIQRKNEEESQRAQLSLILLFISQQGIISHAEAVRLMQPEVPLQEIINLVAKHTNQIKQGMQAATTQWNNAFVNML
jgi:hypothetical protein